ncbi:MAG: hypothetical protein ACJ71G_04050 [Nitrososphaeraceae archaeon]
MPILVLEGVPPERVIELVNQLFNISKAESIPLDQVSGYINEKLQEKQKIVEQIKEADSTLQSKNVTVKAINQHIKLNEELNKNGLTTENIDKLLNVIVNARRYGFDGKEIAEKLYYTRTRMEGKATQR